MQEVLSPSLRIIDTLVYPAPKALFQKDKFGHPFVIEREEEHQNAWLFLKSESTRTWMYKFEQLLFAQFRRPMSLIGSIENLKMYETVGQNLGWDEEQLNAFHQFAVDLPLEGGSRSKNIVRPFPAAGIIKGEEVLAREYEIGKDTLGAVVISEKNISLFFGKSAQNPSGIIPALNVSSKEMAEKYLFSFYENSNLRFIDLSPEGGLVYAQTNDSNETNTKITFVEASRWFHPKFGSSQQLWLRAPNGIPGSTFRSRQSVPLGEFIFNT